LKAGPHGPAFLCYFILVRHSQTRCANFLLLFCLLAVSLPAEDAGDVFWLYSKDRYNRPVLSDRLDVPSGIDPYSYLAEHRGFDDWLTRDEGEVTYLSEKSEAGVVPILCLHKISREEDYALTPERFRRLLRYINDNGWYLVSDLQYIEGDFSRVPTGYKPIVMGSDDASHGNLVYQTRGDRLNGEVKRFFGKPILERDSMVAILEKYAKEEDDRINFTFYISFDAVPFRQLDGYENPGFPYRGVPVIEEKIRYLDENFILGIHSLSHIYAHDMGPAAFAEDVMGAWELIDEYAGGKANSLHTMAFPYGIRPLSSGMRDAVTSLSRDGEYLAGAFDFDNKLAPPPGSPGDIFDVSRFNVDNKNWDRLMRTLEEANAVSTRREIVWEVDTKKLPKSRYALGAAPSDGVWVLVRGQNGSLAVDQSPIDDSPEG
jgi:hypothetical protein